MDEPVKRICIISRAQIRYEGDFVSVEYHDTCGRTITLANVKSFGTENRPAEKKAPPKDVIFEKIMFTENDLVSITFVEEADIIDDPSIVIAEPSYSSNIAPIGTKPNVTSHSHSTQREEMNSWSDKKNENLKFEEKKPIRSNAWENSNSKITNLSDNFSPQQSWVSPNKSYGQQQQNQYTNNNQRNDQTRNHQPNYQLNNNRNNNRMANNNTGNHRFNSNNVNNKRGNYMRGGASSSNNRGNYRNNYTNRRNYPNNNTKENDIPITGEYDIESANKELAAELEKLDLKDSGDEMGKRDSCKDSNDENEEDKVVYDSTKSIFDQLSSQMLDKAMGKKTVTQSFKEERKLNSTTFGSLSTYNDHHRRNYRNYGNQNYRRGGNGGYRRPNNHYNNNYNRNNNYNSNNTNSNVVNDGDN